MTLAMPLTALGVAVGLAVAPRQPGAAAIGAVLGGTVGAAAGSFLRGTLDNGAVVVSVDTAAAARALAAVGLDPASGAV